MSEDELSTIKRYELKIALRESVRLQSHYAKLLNMHDGGKRRGFATAQEWIDRLKEIGAMTTEMKRGDKVMLSGCAPVGEVLRVSQKGVFVQWPPLSGEYVRPCWYGPDQLKLSE